MAEQASLKARHLRPVGANAERLAGDPGGELFRRLPHLVEGELEDAEELQQLARPLAPGKPLPDHRIGERAPDVLRRVVLEPADEVVSQVGVVDGAAQPLEDALGRARRERKGPEVFGDVRALVGRESIHGCQEIVGCNRPGIVRLAEILARELPQARVLVGQEREHLRGEQHSPEV
jgi:hypothetical protein